MASITQNIEDTIRLDELLRIFEIIPDESTNISDGETTYYFYSFSNLESNDKYRLSNIGFESFRGNVFLCETDERKTTEVLEYLLPIFKNDQIGLWDRIIEKMVEINEKGVLFKPSSLQLRIVCVWKGKLTQNEDEFQRFINEMYILFIESCKNNNEFSISDTCKSHKFWNTIYTLRNMHYFHDTGHWGENSRKELIEEKQKIFEFLFLDSPSNKTSLHFIKSQTILLEECLRFLETCSGETCDDDNRKS